MSKLSKLDILMAISAIKIKIRKIFLWKNFFLTLIYTADIAIQNSKIDNFDIDQMSSKFAKR